MNRNVMDALEQVEQAIHRAEIQKISKQARFYAPTGNLFTSTFQWIKNSDDITYSLDSRRRDRWLRDFWKKEPHLAGVINSVVSIDANRGFWLEGGRRQVLRYEAILRDADGNAGWRNFMKSASLSYYTADMGSVVELGRDGEGGPLRALYNVDPVACRLTGDPEYPLAYYNSGLTRSRGYPQVATGDGDLWSASDFFRAVPLPSNDQNLHGLGYCAVSRVLELAMLMIAVYEYDSEKLGARAPKGLLLLNNITQDQWDQAMKARTAKLEAKEQEYYGGVEVIAQMGSEPPDAKLFALSQLPDNFDIQTTTNLLMYAYALCFGYDPIEFWPVAAGALGRGRETDIQHRKGTGKGGMEFVFSLQDRLQQELPDTLLFQFEERDAEGELMDAQIHKAWADVVQVLAGSGIMTPEQARLYLVDKGVIPSEWAEANEQASVDDEGIERGLRHMRDQALENESIRRAIHEYPNEAIVRRRFDPARNAVKEIVLWDKASEATKRSKWVVPDLDGFAGALHRPRRRATVLAEVDGVTITDADVEAAIAQAGERIGDDFAELLQAEPEG